MNITIDKTVSYEVSKVVISSIIINKTNTGLLFMIPFEWKDTSGTTLNRSMKRYTSTELTQLATALGTDFSPFLSMLNGILSGGKMSFRLDLRDASAMKGTIIEKLVTGKYTHVTLEGEAFNSAISPFTQQDIAGIVQLISVQLTA